MRQFSSFGVALLFACACSTAVTAVPRPEPAPPGVIPVAAAPRDAVGGFDAEIPAITLAPGEERTTCVVLPVVMRGPSRMIGGASVDVGRGLHHGNITSRKQTGEGVRPCSGESEFGVVGEVLDGGTVLFVSTTQHEGTEWQNFPAGDAFPIRQGQEIVARMHYLNAGAEPLTVAPRYHWYSVDESSVVHRLAPFVWDNREIDLPPNATTTLSAECGFGQGMNVVTILPHMHRMGTALTASYVGGKPKDRAFFDSKGFDPETSLIQQFDPPLDLGLADGVRFACTWKNASDKRLEWGIGDDEMCMVFGYAWPPESAYSATVSNGTCVYVAGSP